MKTTALMGPERSEGGVTAGQMLAAWMPRYGGPGDVRVGLRPMPAPRRGEVLVRVRAASVNFADCVLMTGRPLPARLALGLCRLRQQTLGMDLAGEVVGVGPGVRRFVVGDRVFGVGRGSYAPLCRAAEKTLAALPEGVSWEAGAASPVAGLTAFQGLRHLQPGQRLLINGASGGVGSFAIQVAKARGAHVTGVCSRQNLCTALDLGADVVVDYRAEAFAKRPERYDAIFDLVGSVPLRTCLGLLRPGGHYISSVGRLPWVAKAALASVWPRGRVRLLASVVNSADLEGLAGLLASGAVRPHIDRRWRLEQVPEALTYQALGHARGKSVVLLDGFG